MNGERNGLWLRHTKHIPGHLWHRYYVAITTRNPWLSGFPVSNNLIYPVIHDGNQKLYRINWQIYTPYAGAVEMLLRINGTPQWENRNNLFCCKASFLRGPHYQFGGVGQDMK